MIKVRNYKHYTKIYLQEISEQAFIESRKKYDELRSQGKGVVVSISKKTWNDFFSVHTATFEQHAETGDEILFLGKKFKIEKARDSKNDKISTVSYYYRHINDIELEEKMERVRVESYMWGNMAYSFLEIAYKNTTGILLFF